MTQEDKKLLLKDLLGRLPYGVKVLYEEEIYQISEVLIFNETITICGEKGYPIEVEIQKVKPYLFPLSSMTEVQLKEMQEIIGNPNEACISVNTLGLELWLNPVGTDPTIWLDSVFEIQDWLNAHYLDYRGLIPMGLAINATGKNIY